MLGFRPRTTVDKLKAELDRAYTRLAEAQSNYTEKNASLWEEISDKQCRIDELTKQVASLSKELEDSDWRAKYFQEEADEHMVDAGEFHEMEKICSKACDDRDALAQQVSDLTNENIRLESKIQTLDMQQRQASERAIAATDLCSQASTSAFLHQKNFEAVKGRLDEIRRLCDLGGLPEPLDPPKLETDIAESEDDYI